MSVLRFSELIVGVPSVMAHGINLDGRRLAPTHLGASATGFTIAVDATNVAVTRTSGGATVEVSVGVEQWSEEARSSPGSLPAGHASAFPAGTDGDPAVGAAPFPVDVG